MSLPGPRLNARADYCEDLHLVGMRRAVVVYAAIWAIATGVIAVVAVVAI